MNFGNSGNSGIFKKVIGQWKALNNLGLATDLFYTDNDNIIVKNPDNQSIKSFSNTLKRLFYTYHGFINDLDVKQYDTMYFRHFFFHPLAVWMLFRLKWVHPKLKIVMEIPTYPYRGHLKIMDLKGKIIAWFDQICSPSFKKYIDLIITFSEYDNIFGISTKVISNGIDSDGIIPFEKPNFNNELHILGLANVQAWHGYDRIIEGLKLYYTDSQNIKVIFHLVGAGDAVPHLKDLTKQYHLEKQVIFYGSMFGESLDKIMQQCHIAVSVLGFQRAGAYQGGISSLKVREYCIKGIPFINGYPDSDIADDFPFAIQVKADETPINIQEVVNYYQNLIAKHPNYPIELNNFALHNLTWQSKLSDIAIWIKNN